MCRCVVALKPTQLSHFSYTPNIFNRCVTEKR
nr:MAG TPA: hypothetical protein [Caudoviricetes sp.]